MLNMEVKEWKQRGNGFAKSHEQHQNNARLLRRISPKGQLSLLLLNLSERTYPGISSHEVYGLCKLICEEATTVSKGKNEVASCPAIDHVLCNAHMKECGAHAQDSRSRGWTLSENFLWWEEGEWQGNPSKAGDGLLPQNHRTPVLSRSE